MESYSLEFFELCSKMYISMIEIRAKMFLMEAMMHCVMTCRGRVIIHKAWEIGFLHFQQYNALIRQYHALQAPLPGLMFNTWHFFQVTLES